MTVEDATRIQYAHHLRSGTTPLTPVVGRWTVEWVAPASGAEPVALHVAANVANDDDSPLGDYIFARAVSVAAGAK